MVTGRSGSDTSRGGIIAWLLDDNDPSLRLQVSRDLLFQPPEVLAAICGDIGRKGWAFKLMSSRGTDGHWGNGAYNPKWTCTHYVLYEMCQLEVPSGDEQCAESALILLSYPRGVDGGINYARTVPYSDVCVNGMILSIACRFLGVGDGFGGDAIPALVDYLLSMRMSDGGWNCAYYSGGIRGSLHTTISVLEGLWACITDSDGLRWAGYRRDEILDAIDGGVEFILRHRLFRSERTGEVIKDDFLKFPFPVRWKYDVLRCLDLFRRYGVPYDTRMDEALDLVEAARGATGRWKAASQPGKTFFIVERNGTDGRWNTLRALRTLGAYREGWRLRG